MQIQECINSLIPVLKPDDSIAMALDWIDEFKQRNLIIVLDNEYLGMIHEDVLLTAIDISMPVSSLIFEHRELKILNTAHITEVISIFQNLNISSVPVTNLLGEFQGSATAINTLFAFSNMANFDQIGAQIILTSKIRSYSLTDISRICENHDTQILSSFILSKKDPNEVDIVIKLNKADVSGIIHSLEHANYIVSNKSSIDNHIDNSKNNLDHLFRYLDI